MYSLTNLSSSETIEEIRATGNRVAEDGMYLHAVDIHLADIKPEQGDLVVVRRMRHGLAEYTAKQLVFASGEWVLRPESYDSEWQDDIKVEGDEDTEIVVTDIVIGKWAPVERRRPTSKPIIDPFR